MLVKNSYKEEPSLSFNKIFIFYESLFDSHSTPLFLILSLIYISSLVLCGDLVFYTSDIAFLANGEIFWDSSFADQVKSYDIAITKPLHVMSGTMMCLWIMTQNWSLYVLNLISLQACMSHVYKFLRVFLCFEQIWLLVGLIVSP